MENNKVLHKNSNHMVTQIPYFEGTKSKSSLQISEAFNKHFKIVRPNVAEKIVSQTPDDPTYLGNEINNARFKLETVSVGHVERAMRALNKSKSPGADRIPVKILKSALHLVFNSLTLIYNASLEKGIFL